MKRAVAAFAILLNLSAFQVHAVTESSMIGNPEEFEFIHCIPVTGSDEDVVTHLVIDIRNEQHKLYSASGVRSLTGKELDLTLLDDKLQANTITTADVSWVSVEQEISLELNILDNGGYSMDGILTHKRSQSPIVCVDVTVE